MPTTIRLPKDIEQRISDLAESTRRPRSFYLREAIVTALPQLEWEYGVAQRAQDVRGGRTKTVSLEQVVEDLGLDD